MNKKYQIFISSTYTDLIEVRREVSRSVMRLTEIPAAMEDFGSIDRNALEHIKTVIDSCDYYVLIVAGRYGYYDESGVSYTEQEYDYAVSKGKPVLAFLARDVGMLPSKYVDTDPVAVEKLKTFRDKVCNPGKRLVTFWDKPEEIQASVAIALANAFRTYPGVGWIRADSIELDNVKKLEKDLDNSKVEIRRLELEIQRLKGEAFENAKAVEERDLSLTELFELFPIQATWQDGGTIHHRTTTLQWIEIFKIIGPLVKRHLLIERVRERFSFIILSQMFSSSYIMEIASLKEENLEDIEYFFVGAELMDFRGDNLIKLTNRGVRLLQGLRSNHS